MPKGLERRYGLGHRHFVTFSCYHRLPFLQSEQAKHIFEASLEATRQKYRFAIDSYVLMPEHVHLLVSEPEEKTLSIALQALKISVARRLTPRPFWQHRFYDFNVFTPKKQIEKRQYMHRNPVVRGLVSHPRNWLWSSYRHWAYGEVRTFTMDSEWTFERSMQQALEEERTQHASCKPTSLKAEMWGHAQEA